MNSDKRLSRAICILLSLFLFIFQIAGCSPSGPAIGGSSDDSMVDSQYQGDTSQTVTPSSGQPSAADSQTSSLGTNSQGSSITRSSTSFYSNSSSTSSTPGTSNRDIATPAIITTKYATEDIVVADVVATNEAYGADNTGVKDSTNAIQRAIDDCALRGGGTVYLPAGKYKVTYGITIKPFVTLRGDWQDPDVGNQYGTIILADVLSTTEDLPALFTVGGSAGVMGLTIYYPKQNIDAVKPYPYTFYVSGTGDSYMLQTIQNCTVINGYKGIGACLLTNPHEMMTIDNVKGTFLYRGATAYNQADVGTWKNLTLSNKYWANAGAGLTKADRKKIDAYTRANGIGLELGDLEWTEFSNVKVADYKIGINIVKGKRIEFAGSFFDLTVERCDVGFQVDHIDERWGTVIAKSKIEGSNYSIWNKTSGIVKLVDVTLTGGTQGSKIAKDTTSLSDVIANYSKSAPKPRARLYPVNADSSGKTDISQTLQKVLNQAGADGGGVVYLPAGKYRMDKAVTVPAKVELRGSSSVPTRDQGGNSSGTIIFAYYGLNTKNPDEGTALVTLNGTNAGIRGIRFIYPKNNPADGVVEKYNYTIRGKADGVYAVNICISTAYNGIDFRGCDNHLIKKLISCCYNNAIYVGNSTGGQIEGCLQNGTVITRHGLQGVSSDFNGWLNEATQIFPVLFDGITRPNTKYIKLSGAKKQTIFNTFAYGINTFLSNENSSNVLVFNIGADNIGGPMLVSNGGSMTVVNMMRWNGVSYTSAATNLKLLNRLTINDANEPNLILK